MNKFKLNKTQISAQAQILLHYGVQIVYCIYIVPQACKNFRDGEKCVESCPQPTTIQHYRLTLNVNFKYEFNGFCVSDCPSKLISLK